MMKPNFNYNPGHVRSRRNHSAIQPSQHVVNIIDNMLTGPWKQPQRFHIAHLDHGQFVFDNKTNSYHDNCEIIDQLNNSPELADSLKWQDIDGNSLIVEEIVP